MTHTSHSHDLHGEWPNSLSTPETLGNWT